MFHDSPDDEPPEGTSVGRRTPWQNDYAERVIGSIRRECVDHVIVVNAAGLTACSWTTSCTTCAREHISCLARTRRARVRLHRRRPVALSPFQKSAVCTILTNASRRNRRAAPINYFRPHHPSVKQVCAAVMTATSAIRCGSRLAVRVYHTEEATPTHLRRRSLRPSSGRSP